MKFLFLCFASVLSFTSFTQSDTTRTIKSLIQEISHLEEELKDKSGNPMNFNKLDSVSQSEKEEKTELKKRDSVVLLRGDLRNSYVQVLDLLFYTEKSAQSYNSRDIQNPTAYYLSHFKDVNQLKWLLMLAQEYQHKSSTALAINEHIRIRENIVTQISNQMNRLSKERYCLYSYNHKKKQFLKGVVIEHANDLLGIVNNFDMDYTGGVKIGILTDFLKVNRYRPVKSYQMLYFGADVYTPYFKDTSIFKTDTSYNVFDRPHASFQYFGLSTNAISRKGNFRWQIDLKLGRIGGNKAEGLQSTLHQDLTESARPQGWGAQIANPGRLGFSVEYRPEVIIKQFNFRKNTWGGLMKQLVFVGKANAVLGNFKTFTEGGLTISNKNFISTNQNFMSKRKQTYLVGRSKAFWNNLYLALDLNAKYSIYNSSLQGYGIYKSFEKNDDYQAPKSLHSFERDQLQPVIYSGNFLVSYQTQHFALYYKYTLRSPVIKPIIDGTTGTDYLVQTDASNDSQRINIYTRWHRWGTLGIVFTLDK